GGALWAKCPFRVHSLATTARTCTLNEELAARPRAVQHRALVQRHQVPPVLAVGALHRLEGVQPGLGQLLAQVLVLVLQLDHPAHALQVEPGVGELLDAAQAVDVPLAVAATAAAGAGRVDQAPPLVDAQGLRVHASQLGGHGDDVDGQVLAVHHTPRCARGESGKATASCSTA